MSVISLLHLSVLYCVTNDVILLTDVILNSTFFVYRNAMSSLS